MNIKYHFEAKLKNYFSFHQQRKGVTVASGLWFFDLVILVVRLSLLLLSLVNYSIRLCREFTTSLSITYLLPYIMFKCNLNGGDSVEGNLIAVDPVSKVVVLGK